MSTVEQLMREDLRYFNSYSSARKEASAALINLNANESPWESGFNRYPEQQPLTLVEKCAQYFSVDNDEILITRGSDEGIDCLMRLFCRYQQDSIIISPPTFGMYAVSAQLQGAKVIEVKLQDDSFAINVDAIIAQCQDNTKIVFICSPNNPTGSIVPIESILFLCKNLLGKAIVVVDEAYIDFSVAQSCASYIKDYDNLVLLRTFSKAFGLAAARVGVLMAQAPLISWLKKILAPYPIAQTSAEAVLKYLQPKMLEKINKDIGILVKERARLMGEFKEMAIVSRLWPSDANFLLLQFALPIVERCQQHGIVLRKMDNALGLSNAVRITIGSPNENDKLLEFLRSL